MNGTVAIGNLTTGIEAKTFNKAKAILKKTLEKNCKNNYKIKDETDGYISYTIRNEFHPVFGIMKNEPLKIIGVKNDKKNAKRKTR